MKTKELHELSDEELKNRSIALQRELNIERGAKEASGSKAPNPGKLRSLKKLIARILTVLNQRRKGIIK